MIVVDCVQGSPEWHAARLGVLTASAASQILTPTKLQPSKQRDGYLARLLHEWATGSSAEEFGGSAWTEHGHQYEGEALDAFRLIAGVEARAVGLIYQDESRRVACSPDWLGIDDNCTIEVKCPAGWTHISWLLGSSRARNSTGGVPPQHVPQVQWQIWCAGVARGYFVSYAAPRDDMPWRSGAAMPPLVVEVEPDPRWQDALSEHVPAFVAEMLEARAELEAMGVTPWRPGGAA